jgi:hypothetical protein
MGGANQDFLRRNTGFLSSYPLSLVAQPGWYHATINDSYHENLAFAGKGYRATMQPVSNNSHFPA